MTAKTFDALWMLYKPRRVRGKKSEQETIRLYETHIQPRLGRKSVVKTTFETIDELHQEMKSTPYQANRVLSLIRPLFKYAQAIRWIAPEHNPAKHVKMFSERKRRRHMNPKEAPRIATAIRRRELAAPEACLFLWFIIFTGARPGEIKAARWKDIKGNRLTLEDHKSSDKTGAQKIISLPPIVLDKLKLLKPGRPEQKIITIGTPEYIWRSVRVEAKCRDLRIYDLRHTFATYALEQGFTLEQIGESLGHANVQTTKIYAEMNTRSRQRVALDSSLAILNDMDVKETEDAFD